MTATEMNKNQQDWGKWLLMLIFPMLIAGFAWTNVTRIQAIEEKNAKQDEQDQKLADIIGEIKVQIAKLDAKSPSAEEWKYLLSSIQYLQNQKQVEEGLRYQNRRKPGGN